jgi:ankyrin repeat protein
MRTMYASRNMFEFQELPKGVISSIRIPRIKCRHQEYYDMELLYRLKNKKFFIGVPRLLKEGANPTIRDEHGLTPLHIAAYRGLFKEVRLLINAGADMNAVDISSVFSSFRSQQRCTLCSSVLQTQQDSFSSLTQ